MALAETVIRLIHKYQMIPKAIRYLPVILLLVALLLVAWMAVLPMDGQYRNTYILENALMPFQVTLYFRESEWNFVRGYRHELEQMESMDFVTRQATMKQWLDDIGIVTDYHSNTVANDTLYGVMHAPRGDDTEAVVLAIPWYTSDDKYNLGAAAIAVTLMRYFSRMSIWSRNIVVVFPETSRVPLRQWVEAYHTLLPLNAGEIDAAIVMEYSSGGDFFDYYEMFYEGLNGQLPNLDLLNTCNTIGYHEGIHECIQNTPNVELTKNTYWTRFRTLARGVMNLAAAGLTPRTSKGCEAFSGWLIQAFTIKAIGDEGDHDITQFGRVVDLTLRSVNNLLEKFHQSFFFYFLLLPKNFILIGTYLPAAVFLAVAFAIGLLAAVLGSRVLFPDYMSHNTATLTAFVAIEGFSFTLSVVLQYLAEAGLSEMVLAGGIAVAAVTSGLVYTGRGSTLIRISKPTRFSLIGLLLFYISMLITALLIVHFSLALIVGWAAIPLIFVAPILNQQLSLAKLRARLALCLLVSNPFVMVAVAGAATGDGGSELMRGLLTAWDEIQCWTWYVVILGWFPAWLGVVIGTISDKPQDRLETKEKVN